MFCCLFYVAKPIENGFSGVTNHTPATNTSGYKSDMSFDSK